RYYNNSGTSFDRIKEKKMNELIASVFSGLIIDENDENYFIQKNDQTFKLKKTDKKYELGEAVEGFGYVNQQHEAVLTTEIPKIRKVHYAFIKVVEVRRNLGVFVDIGLPDKDNALSLDELPEMHELWTKKGDCLMVSLRVDDKARIWACLAEEMIFQSL